LPDRRGGTGVAEGLLLHVYLDHHATTPVDSGVLEVMLPYFSERFGNAASKTHQWGWDANEGVDTAREQVGALIGARAREIVWTSGATESNNLAIQGAVEFYAERGDHVVTATTEHKAVLDCCRALERAGRIRATYLPVDGLGRVDPNDVRAAITDRTVLVSIMHANNEIGTLQPIAEIGAIARERGTLFHTDAAQSAAFLPIDVETMSVDLLSLSAHKMYGPKGCGALFVRGRNPRARLRAILHGGGHERGMRSGTLNVPGIVGMGAACELAARRRVADAASIGALRDRLQSRLFERVTDLQLNGDPASRLPGNLNIGIRFIEGDSLMMALAGIAVSSGSACTSASLEPSHVLKAIGLADGLAQGSIRFGIGRGNTAEEIDYVVERVSQEVSRLRAMSPEFRRHGRV
jgi:cysteine desulfurase